MGRNPNKNQQAKDIRREKILSAALMLFSSKGLAATKISDIAQQSGMSQGLLYHYFSSKEQIYVDILHSAFARLNEACLNLENDPSPPGKKIAMALEVLIHNLATSDNAARYHVLIAQANLLEGIPEQARKIIQAESALPYQVFTRIMMAGQADGSIKLGDPEQLATAFWTTIKGLALHQAVHKGRSKLPDASLFKPIFLKD